jgi:hypothetical protein
LTRTRGEKENQGENKKGNTNLLSPMVKGAARFPPVWIYLKRTHYLDIIFRAISVIRKP